MEWHCMARSHISWEPETELYGSQYSRFLRSNYIDKMASHLVDSEYNSVDDNNENSRHVVEPQNKKTWSIFNIQITATAFTGIMRPMAY